MRTYGAEPERCTACESNIKMTMTLAEIGGPEYTETWWGWLCDCGEFHPRDRSAQRTAVKGVKVKSATRPKTALLNETFRVRSEAAKADAAQVLEIRNLKKRLAAWEPIVVAAMALAVARDTQRAHPDPSAPENDRACMAEADAISEVDRAARSVPNELRPDASALIAEIESENDAAARYAHLDAVERKRADGYRETGE